MANPSSVAVSPLLPLPAASVGVAVMQAMDRIAIQDLGIPRLLLMDHAGLAVARQVTPLATDPRHPILICCGTGYNGGDGLAAGRHLKGWGFTPQILLAGTIDQLRQESLIFARILQRLDVPIREVPMRADARIMESFSTSAVVVDALLGIGLQGAVREPAASLIEAINRCGKPVIAVDIPSGLDGDTGAVQGMAVRATMTVTFGRIKRGCLAGEGPAHSGRIILDPITIPYQVLNPS